MREIYKEKSVDIIIPIYNAYEDLVKCLESIYKNTDLEKNRLILVNDNSSDDSMRPFLEQQKRNNVLVFHNESNKGFSNNVNLGMKQSEDNDVVLLNSDTIVTNRWIEKILECAYSNEAIGTVTPLSNNATLCSVPEFCEENSLPEYLNIDQAGAIVERCSMKKYPRITTAHGFCMFIKREVINTIGYFDAKTFELGYGEENDFCNRAEQAGYHHVMCDNTYIYHSGTKSFVSHEKEKYIRQHDRILRERYPEQMHLNDVHVRDNPNGFVGENVSIYFDLENGKKNILYILQSDFRKDATDNVGGTQFHVRDLMLGMRDEYNVFVAARNGLYLNLTAYYGKQEKEFRFYIGPKGKIYEFRNQIFKVLWDNILSAFHIDFIHVHHVANTSLDIFYAAKEYNIPIAFTVHDYNFICPSILIKMENDGEVSCIGREHDCRDCLNKWMGITDQIDYIKIWRKWCNEVLDICKVIIAPDESVRNVLMAYYPSIKNKLEIIEHGYSSENSAEKEIECLYDVAVMYEGVQKEGPTYKVTGWAYLRTQQGNTGQKVYLEIRNSSGEEQLIPAERIMRPDVIADGQKCRVGFSCVIPQKFLDGESLCFRIVLEDDDKFKYALDTYETPKLPKAKKRLNVAFVGGLNKAKGGEYVSKIVENFETDVNWYVFGGIGVAELASQKRNNLIKTGYYMPEDLPILLKAHEIDVIGILSIWPETYSYTLTESVLNGIPVIVTDVGALGRRTREMECGWIISLDNMEKHFQQIVRELIANRSKLEEFKKIISKIQFPDIVYMANKYQELYEGLWTETRTYPKTDYEMIFEGYNVKTWTRRSALGYSAQNEENVNNETIDGYFKFKRYLQNNHPKLYVLLRKFKGGVFKKTGSY